MNQHSNPWVRAHARIQRLKKPTSPPAGAAATADAAAERAGAGAVVGLASQLERAVRTSAVVKLLSRSLLAGALQPARHLMITSPPPPALCLIMPPGPAPAPVARRRRCQQVGRVRPSGGHRDEPYVAAAGGGAEGGAAPAGPGGGASTWRA